MPTFKAPMINLYSRDLPRAAAFYSALISSNRFAPPSQPTPSTSNSRSTDSHSESRPSKPPNNTTASASASMDTPSKSSYWTDNTDAAVSTLTPRAHRFSHPLTTSSTVNCAPHGSPTDPDGNRIQLVSLEPNLKSIIAEVGEKAQLQSGSREHVLKWMSGQNKVPCAWPGCRHGR